MEQKISSELYKQEGSIVPFTAWPWMMAIDKLAKKYFKFGFQSLDMYFKKEYGHVYWRKDALNKVAQFVYSNYLQQKKLEKFYAEFLQKAEALERIYKNTILEQLSNYNDQELEKFFNKLWWAYEEFWAYSLFIDGFDTGLDQQKIREAAKKYDLTVEEIGVLTTPSEITFNNKRLFDLLNTVKIATTKNLDIKKLANFIQNNSLVKRYIKNFDYYKSNYAQIKHISLDEIKEEIKKYLRNKKLFDEEYYNLKNYSKLQEEKIATILTKHKLKSNPLAFFAKLTYWREKRKQVNLMGIHVLNIVLDVIAQKTGISQKYLKYLCFDEINHALSGLINLNILKRRRDKGILVSITGTNYKIIGGEEATSVGRELEKRLIGEAEEQIITGQVASQGYAKGVARIVLDQNDFGKLKEEEILVTGMTRPEFLPVIKKAAAIVTNEGGITCHAAIVSRELGKPCIIGTKNAAQLIKDGDLIEVRANHGTVRILKNKGA